MIRAPRGAGCGQAGRAGTSRSLGRSNASISYLHHCIIGARGKVAPLHFCCVAAYDRAMPDAAEPAVRKTFSLPASLWQRIEDYQFRNRIKRDAEALRRLLERALEVEEAPAAPAPAPRKARKA